MNLLICSKWCSVSFLLLLCLHSIDLHAAFDHAVQVQTDEQSALNRAVSDPNLSSAPLREKRIMHFEKNLGQHSHEVAFLSRGDSHALSLQQDRAVLSLKQGADSSVVELTFLGADSSARVSGTELLPAKVNYLIGAETDQWHTNIPTYEKVIYEQLYAGVDLEFYGNQNGFEYDFIVKPGIDTKVIDIAFEGVDKLSLDAHGTLLLHAGTKLVRQPRPLIYQDVGGVRHIIEGGYELRGPNRVGFRVAAYDQTRALIIDPVIDFSTFFGGSGNETFGDMALDTEGNIYLVGATSSVDFPVSFEPWQDSLLGSSDLFISKFSSDGSTLLYSTYLGGTGDEWGLSQIAVDGTGNVYVSGQTESLDFPVSDWAFQKVRADSSAYFVAKLNPAGSSIVYATLLDATSSVSDPLNIVTISDLAVDSAGHAYVTGYTNSTFFPTTDGALKNFLGGNGYCGSGKCYDAFVSKFDLTGSSLVYSTYLGDANPGGSGAWGQNDRAYGIAVDNAGHAYVTGNTNGAAYPVTEGAFQVDFMGGGMFGEYGDAFISKLDPTGAALIYSTFLGGRMLDGESVGGVDFGFDIAVDRFGNAYVTGSTSSKDFPVTLSAFQPELNFGGDRCAAAITTNLAPCPDAFVAKLNAAGSALLYSTYLGGLDYDSGKSIAVDAAGVIHVAGGTDSTDFPLTDDAFQITQLGGGSTCGTGDACDDGFVIKIDAMGTNLIYSSYLGGSDNEPNSGIEIAADNRGYFYLAGDTRSVDFPLQSPYQSTTSGSEIFVTRFGDLTPLNDDTEFVKQLYLDLLNREADQGGLSYWVGELESGGVSRAELTEQYLLSAEFGQTVAPVVRLYFTYFLRIPDYDGLMFWVNNFAAGMTLNEISNEFAKAPEFIARYGVLSNEEFVTQMYQNVYGREPDSGGLAYWTGLLDTEALTRGQVMVFFSTAEEYLQLSANQVYVTMTYIGLLRRSPEQEGFDFWVAAMDSGASGLALIQEFLDSEEYAARFLVVSAAEVPGYAGEYFPFDLGKTWVYEGTYENSSGASFGYANTVSVVGTKVIDGVKATIFHETNSNNSGIPESSYLYKEHSGISYYGSDDPSDVLSAQLAPYYEVKFPVEIGETFVQVDRSGLDFGEDLDGDFINEQVNVYSEVQVVGLGPMTVLAGTFEDSAEVITNVNMDIRLSKTGGWLTATAVSRSWYAPEVGPIKNIYLFTMNGYSEQTTEELAGHYTLLAEDLAAANSDTESPGKPSVGYDGTNYLVVTRQVVSQTNSVLVGVIVSPDGVVLKKFDISSGDTEWTLSANRTGVAFDGQNYLVVFGRDGDIVGTRVTPEGVVLDGDGFVIGTVGTNIHPVVEFDGANFLVAWAKFQGTYDIYGALVSPAGEAQQEFPVFVEVGEQVAPAIAFDGSNYLVAWRDTRWDGSENVVELYASRVSPAGVPLDPSGIALSTAPGDQEAPDLASDGNNFFAVWADGRAYAPDSGQYQGMDIYGARIASNGTVLDVDGIPINIEEYLAYDGKANPTVAFNGTNYFVGWQTGAFPNSPPAGIFANWVSPSGQLLSALVDDAGLSMSGAPTSFAAKYVYPAAGSGAGHVFLTWVNLIELSGESKDLFGKAVKE